MAICETVSNSHFSSTNHLPLIYRDQHWPAVYHSHLTHFPSGSPEQSFRWTVTYTLPWCAYVLFPLSTVPVWSLWTTLFTKRLTSDSVTRRDPIPPLNFALIIRCLPAFGVHEVGRSADEIGGYPTQTLPLY